MNLSNEEMLQARDLFACLRPPPPSETPVFVRTCFTGQPETAREEVVCPVCGSLVHLRTSAWFDSYNLSARPDGGCYVHYHCLSHQRKAELAEHGYAFT